MTPFAWCSNFIYLRGEQISFDRRPYLPAIYNSVARRVVLRCSRQVEKTTFICNMVTYIASMIPRVKIIVVFPRLEQARGFAKSRLTPILEESPVIRRLLRGSSSRRLQVTHMQFRNGSELYIRAAYHSADPVRGIDGDFLFIDEYQDIADGNLPVLEETLSHSPHRRVFLTGTPKSVDNHLEGAFSRSTANEWIVPCDCGEQLFLDENVLGLGGPECPTCHAPINATTGRWRPRNPDSLWGDGFTINHLATYWVRYRELLEKQSSYNPALFRNECLGLPSYLGDHVVTREQTEACCAARSMAQSINDVPADGRPILVAGIDWGGGAVSRTVLVVGFMRNDRFVIVFMERYQAMEDPDAILESIARRCQQFRVAAVAADGGGNGSVYNPLLLHRLPELAGLYGLMYTNSNQEPRQHAGRYWLWAISRTGSLGMIFTRIKAKRIEFPKLDDCSSFLAEIYCEVAEHDDQNRTIKYTHPETQPDDALHAINYACTLARRHLDHQMIYA